MSTFLFSAVFDRVHKPERLAFLERVFHECPESTKFLGFNIGPKVRADFPIINAQDFAQDSAGKTSADAATRLREVLQSAVPEQADALYDQAVGELGAASDKITHQLEKLIANIEAFQATLKKHRPDKVVLWNQFNAFHRIVAALCHMRGISAAYFHDGVLPGSIAFDLDGEMGESWLARSPERFAGVPVSNAEFKSANRFLQRLINRSNKSRHSQVEGILVDEALKLVGLHDRVLIFYAGQHDWHAGIKPRGPTSHLHSPVFADTLDGLREIDRIAGKMGAAVLFKPHPLSRNRYEFLHAEDYPNTLILSHTDLNICIARCNVAITIASQVSYVAMMSLKPVVMLGRNQLTGKSLTYDIDSRDSLRNVIETALKDPKRGTRWHDFVTHMAQLQKVYLFDYCTLKNEFYTRGPGEVARFLDQSLAATPEAMVDVLVGSEAV